MRLNPGKKLIVPVIAVGLVLTACGGSDTATRRTVTVVEGVSSGAAAPSSGAGATVSSGPGGSASGAVTVVAPESGGAGESGSAAGSGASAPADSSAAPSSTAASGSANGTASGSGSAGGSTSSAAATASSTAAESSAAPTLKKVDPLAASCAPLITQHDIKVITGVTVTSATRRIRDVANEKVNSTGSIRCLYGVVGASEYKLSMRLTQYKSEADAKKQVTVTVESEKDLGAKVSEVKVDGLPGTVMLRDGGLVSMQYGNWTLSIASVNGWMTKADVPAQLTTLAETALTRLTASAN